MKKYRGLVSIVMIALQIIIVNPFYTLSYAAEEQGSKEKEVVFLLDASGSMKSNDPKRLAIDSIAQLVYSLPSNYKVGVVAYNEEVILAQELVEASQREQLMKLAEQISYADYTNAGAGLAKAVELLQPEGSEEKTIVMLSDGEILLESAMETEQSFLLYQTGIGLAVQAGIKINVIGLGSEMENTENSIFMAAAKTGGEVYYTPQAVGIQNAIDSILNEQLQIKQTTVAIVDTDGTMESLPIELPFVHASKVRVLLCGNAVIQNLNTNFQAESAKQINGERYSLIELAYPKNNKIDLNFSSAAGSRIRITVIPEYNVVPRSEVTYEDRLPDNAENQYYDREATTIFNFYDAENPNRQLWTESYFDQSKLPVQVDEVLKETALKNGAIQNQVSVHKDTTQKVSFDYSQLSVNVLGINEVSVALSGPPALPPVEPEPPYGLYLLGVVVVFGGGAVFLLFRRPKPVQMPPDEKPEPGKYSFTGKLNIYITRAPSGYDIPPLSYNLLRLPSTKVIALDEILENCEVKERFEGADRIYFKSGAGRSLIVTNNSDCTIMKNREILMKKKSYQLSVETKVDVTFEDEMSELTFQYKDLKPSEM